MRRWYLWLFAVVVALWPVVAFEEAQWNSNDGGLYVVYPQRGVYSQGSNISFRVQLYNVTGIQISTTENAVCYVWVYDDYGHLIYTKTMLDDGADYVAYLDNNSRLGIYDYTVTCVLADLSRGGFASASYRVTVDGTYEEPGMFVAALILVPLLFAFVLALGALSAKSHPVLQAFMFILSVVPVLSGLHLGLVAVIKFYDWPAMQDAIGTNTWWMAMALFAVIAYWLIYLVAKMFHVAAQKRNERLEY